MRHRCSAYVEQPHGQACGDERPRATASPTVRSCLSLSSCANLTGSRVGRAWSHASAHESGRRHPARASSITAESTWLLPGNVSAGRGDDRRRAGRGDPAAGGGGGGPGAAGATRARGKRGGGRRGGRPRGAGGRGRPRRGRRDGRGGNTGGGGRGGGRPLGGGGRRAADRGEMPTRGGSERGRCPPPVTLSRGVQRHAPGGAPGGAGGVQAERPSRARSGECTRRAMIGPESPSRHTPVFAPRARTQRPARREGTRDDPRMGRGGGGHGRRGTGGGGPRRVQEPQRDGPASCWCG